MADFDAIVVGSGMSGGMSAKELTERGLKVLVLERGPEIIPERDYTDNLNPWEKPNLDSVPQDEIAEHYPRQYGGVAYAIKESTKTPRSPTFRCQRKRHQTSQYNIPEFCKMQR